MFKKKDKYAVAVIGATGAVGREMLEILEERAFPVSGIVPLASERSEGERVEFKGKNVIVRRLATDSFQDVDIAFFPRVRNAAWNLFRMRSSQAPW